ncbi:thiol:disulfide interchange protein DsbA [Orbus hercynius]|uniref:Thiol:disulfide interchange protein n=1 Tax=Orbus hercynius TaxID=593135 RepID=A0A495RCP2_9GAMM|nr:thiol:disulfide interchange protein DsbA/DsbL [Orbus hercynius]RKS85129.1 thiol:disulfide interchange protein DsbA [Orbus hercynius]
MHNILKSLVIALLFSLSYVADAELIENQDYIVLNSQIAKDPSPQDKIEVIEFFSYGCPYCDKLEPQIAQWLAQKPANVTFTRIAIPRKGKWNEYARLFYALGMISPAEQDRITPLMYAAIHKQKLSFENDDAIFSWAQRQGINRKLLEKYYNSEVVSDKLKLAMELARSFGLKYVPSIYVNHQYQLILDSSNQYQGAQDKLNELITISSK